jgi:hypothetical protein
MKTIIISLICFSSLPVLAQQKDWSNMHNWKLYSLRDDPAMRCPLDSLQFLKSVALKRDSINYYLNQSSAMTVKSNPVWMGAYILSFNDSSGMLHKIDVSVYGGFFYLEDSKTYYEIPRSLRKPWINFIERSFEGIPSD